MTKFVSAQAMHSLYPATFQVPDDADLKAIFPGQYVKICTDSERFWVEVTERTGDVLTGRVDNDLIRTDEHGHKCNDLVEFEICNIYAIMGVNNET